MRRDELEHVIRAAASVLGDDGVIIVGSQVAHAALTAELPDVVARSVEADVLPLDDAGGDKAYLVNGTIGEESPFHETFGIYAEGMHEENLVLPRGWRDRLVPLRSEGTRWLMGWCLDPHDARRREAVGRSPP